MGKPVIGIVSLYDEQKESMWMLPNYTEGITAAGGVPFMLPLRVKGEDLKQLYGLCDGLLLTGGQDVDPAMYGESRRDCCREICHIRDEAEQALFTMAFADDKPVFGICRGLQIINVLMRGSLYQDLSTERPGGTGHQMEQPYDRVCHTVTILKDTPLYGLLGQDMLGVNSCHHQGIKELSGDLIPMAVSEDGLVEAFCVRDKIFIWAVQWHPELAYQVSEPQLRLLKAFVDACRKGKEDEN